MLLRGQEAGPGLLLLLLLLRGWGSACFLQDGSRAVLSEAGRLPCAATAGRALQP